MSPSSEALVEFWIREETGLSVTSVHEALQWRLGAWIEGSVGA